MNAEEIEILRHERNAARNALNALFTRLDEALVQIFGAEPERIVVTNPDHFSITCDLRQLCTAAGGPWAKLVSDLEERTAELKTKKYAGPDPRLTATAEEKR